MNDDAAVPTPCGYDPNNPVCHDHSRLASEHTLFREGIEELRRGQVELQQGQAETNSNILLVVQEMRSTNESMKVQIENDRKARDRDYDLLRPTIEFMQNYIAREQCDEQKNWEAELAARQKNSEIQLQYQQKLIKMIVAAFAKIAGLCVAGYFGIKVASALMGGPLF